MDDTKVARINELYHKSKTPEGLTTKEKQEQQTLRQEYLQAIRKNMKQTIENTVVEYPDGRVVSLEEAYKQNKNIKVKIQPND